MSAWPRVEAVAGIKEALARLLPDWTIALATNAADSEEHEIWSALARVGLGRLIDRVYCFRGVGLRKSAPEYFEHVLEDLGIDRDRAVMVGDDFEADVLSANRSGIRAIWFHENGTETETGAMHRTIHSLPELPEALELLLR
jgi:putative hydrolase of the HAD superfamily